MPMVTAQALSTPEKRPAKNTYGQILKSSALIGGSSIIRIALGFVRTKAMTLILGPAGYGLVSIYQSITDLAQAVAGMGLNTSGVRQIAESVGTGDNTRIARTIITVRRVTVIFGAAGALLLAVFCKPIARLSFRGDVSHAPAIAWLALAVFFGAVSNGQLALVQGMRRITFLARASALGGLYGTLFSIPIVYFWKAEGIVPSLVCVAAMSIVTSWWYSRQIPVEAVTMTSAQVVHETSALLKLGFIFMATSLMSFGVAYLTRIIILDRLTLEAAGNYYAAWTLGGMYVGIVLQAMGADFFPRLTAAAADNRECNRLVNEQAEMSLLLAAPGILGTLTFTPLVIQVLASQKFGAAIEILRWICLGMMLRVASWPMGFILLAKGARWLFFWSELVTATVSLGLVWLGVKYVGLNGTGMAFFGTYIFYWFVVYAIVRRLSGFRWSSANRRIGLLHTAMILAVFAAWYYLPLWLVYSGGTLITLIAGIHSAKTICSLIPLDRLPAPARRLIVLFRLTPLNQNQNIKE
jgi:PST family polysaccharide transporter